MPDRSCADAPDEREPGGAALYGVFLTVGTLNGSIRFFDVHDLDVACRGSGCNDNTEADDQPVAIGRHRPRIGVTLELDERTRERLFRLVLSLHRAWARERAARH